MKNAYFAGGCFWCIASVFDALKGVTGVVSGFSGGSEPNPEYEDVKAQRTTHRETVKVIYDDAVVDYETLVSVLLANVDPHDPDGQFIDRGRSYSLAVYYETPREKEIAERLVGSLERETGKPVFVAIEPFSVFYAADEHHQDYHNKHPSEFRKELISSGRASEDKPE
ncbi:MAG: peptide-methionine (S)-S-oxide reductase MsrA [Clostridia bacterium]|nr:peptide-methionine (S)-S-oxide reductase MsrA [Clostridia bacterium]